MAEIQEFVEIENKQAIGYLELYNKKNIYKTLVAQACQCSQQLTGGNVIMYYVVFVFQMAGLTGSINLISSSVQYVIFLVFTIPTLLMVDKIGRRPLMIYGSIAMGVCMFIIAAILAEKGEYADSIGGNENIHITLENSPHASRAVLVFSYLFTMFYSLTWAPTAWVYCPEVFDQRTRSRGMAVAAASNWAMNFALAFYVPPAFDQIGWKTFIIFGVFNAVSAIYIYFTFPETARKSLEEIEELFAANGPKPWKTRTGSDRFEQTKEEFKQNPVAEVETEQKSSMDITKADTQHFENVEKSST